MTPEQEIVLAIVLPTVVIFMLIIALIITVIYAKRAFRRGIKWADQNNIRDSLNFITERGLTIDYKEFKYNRMLKRHE